MTSEKKSTWQYALLGAGVGLIVLALGVYFFGAGGRLAAPIAGLSAAVLGLSLAFAR